MKRKHLLLAIAALLVAGGLWLGRSTWRSGEGAVMGGTNGAASSVASDSARSASRKSSTSVGSKMSSNRPTSGLMPDSPPRLAPPVPNRRFTDFTPEQRVQFARQGHGPGG